MKIFLRLHLLIALCISFNAQSQSNKKAIDHSVYDQWNAIKSPLISQNGQWVVYTLKPQEGDSKLAIQRPDKKFKTKIPRGYKPQISFDNQFVVFRIKPQLAKVKALRRKKTKKHKLPKDSLGIYDLSKKTLVKIPRVKSFKLPKKGSEWVAYQLEAPKKKKKKKTKKKDKKKTEDKDKDKAKKEVKKKKKKKEGKKNGTKLIIRNLKTTKQDTFKFVKSYHFSENGSLLTFITTGNSKKIPAGVYVYDLKNQKLKPVFQYDKAKFTGLAVDHKGEQIAFLAYTDTTKKNKKALIKYYHLYYWQNKTNKAIKLADEKHKDLQKDWLVSQFGKVSFSENGQRLYFGTSPKPIVQDTSLLPEEIVKVDVWNWQDKILQSRQNFNLKKDKKRTYTAVINLANKNKLVQITTPEIPYTRFTKKRNSNNVILLSSVNYEKYASWDGFPKMYDVYAMDLNTGKKKQFLTKTKLIMEISRGGNYACWYQSTDSTWYTYNIKTQKINNLTKDLKVAFYRENHDMPQLPHPYFSMGWSIDDKKVYIYDRYDIWKFDPDNRAKPKRITNGRNQKISYRLQPPNRDYKGWKTNGTILLKGTNEETCAEAFYSLKLGKNAKPKKLFGGDFRLRRLKQAAKNDALFFTKETFQEFPDLHYTDVSFKKVEKISDANPQQKDYLWGTVETVTWTSTNGDKLKGLLYKPENFDPKKKYPMITYFYEKSSQDLHLHWFPQPSWSIIIASVYVSNGYMVFMPDIPYQTGYPGHSAEHAILSGVTSLVNQGFVDSKRIGVQGQSWGGYQVAHLITRSNIFAAGMAGAPVSNMTSAYGGIRWGSGYSRMFQYEKSQSRIGGSLWQKPLQYIENSPVFSANRVQTPLLMMHNDKDGAVPWYQGIEYFVALRRLQKPVWMLTYNGEAHNLRQRKNRKDLTIRMMQFFDHYLKGEEAPVWMAKGIPAIQKGIKKGYKLVKSNNKAAESKDKVKK